MTGQPASFDGIAVDVLVNGEWRASGVLEDRRYVGDDRRIHEQVYLRIDDCDEAWGRQLPRAGGEDEHGALRSITVDLKLDNGRNLQGVSLGRPWTEAIGAPVATLAFPLGHDEL